MYSGNHKELDLKEQYRAGGSNSLLYIYILKKEKSEKFSLLNHSLEAYYIHDTLYMLRKSMKGEKREKISAELESYP